jgi:hypothetical protein
MVNRDPLGQVNSTSNGWFHFVDANTTNWLQRFYRAGAA